MFSKLRHALFSKNKKNLFAWSGFFYLISTVIFCLLIARYLTFVYPFETSLVKLYAPATLVGQTFLFFTVFYLVTALLILLTGYGKLVKAVGICTSSLFMIYLIVDFGVYSQYRFHLNKIVIDLLVGGGKEIFDFSSSTLLFISAMVLSVFVIQVTNSWISQKCVTWFQNKKKYIFIPYLTVSLLCVIIFNVVNAWADVNYQRDVTRFTRHIPIFYPLTAKKFLQKHGFVDLSKKKDSLQFKVRKNRPGQVRYPVKPLLFDENGDPLNLLFIVLDCFRFDMLTEQVTPNIHQFQLNHDTQNFTHHFSGGNGTRIGIFSLFYGLPGTYWNLMYEEQVSPLLVQEIVKRNYQTGIFASAKLTTPPFNRTVFNDIKDLRTSSTGDSAWQRDENAVSDWLNWIENADKTRPFFGFIFLDAAHAYAYPPGYSVDFGPVEKEMEYHRLNNERDPVPIRNKFKTSLHYADSLIGPVLKDLEKRNLVENTVIIITGDHGQEFNENRQNFWGHGSNFTKYQIQVPLVISWPGKKEQTFTHLSTHFDVPATLMNELFLSRNDPSDFTSGQSLFNKTERKWFVSGGFSKTAIVEKDRITVSFATGTYEIFDKTNREQKSAKLRPDILKEVFKELSRFN